MSLQALCCSSDSNEVHGQLLTGHFRFQTYGNMSLVSLEISL